MAPIRRGSLPRFGGLIRVVKGAMTQTKWGVATVAIDDFSRWCRENQTPHGFLNWPGDTLSLSLSLHRHFGRNTGDSGGGGDCLLRRASRKMYHGNISWEYIYIYIMELLEKMDKHIIKSLEAWFQSNSNLQHLQHYKFGHWVTTKKKSQQLRTASRHLRWIGLSIYCRINSFAGQVWTSQPTNRGKEGWR